jgi:DnaK suppressor protein
VETSDTADRDEIAALLGALRASREAERRELSESLAVVLDLRADGTADDEHDPEGPTLSAEWSRVSGLHTELAAKDDALDRAVARLAAGTSGVCIRCGRPIGMDRLRARPTTEHCIGCARELEGRRR